MNDQNEQSCCGSCSTFLPTLLIGLALCIFFIWQINATSKQGAAFKATVQQQTQLVDQSKKVQGSLERLVLDLLDLARSGDEDAKAVVAKYGIQQQGQQNAPAK